MKISYETIFQIKTVRFDESVDFRSPKVDDICSSETSVPEIGKPASLETTVSFTILDFFLHEFICITVAFFLE